MSLAIITPTRRRMHALYEQAIRLAPQLRDDDCWVIVIDQDEPPQGKMLDKFNQLIGETRLHWCLLHYLRSSVPVARVSHARNVGVAMAPAGFDIVEVDDHDPIEPNALELIRSAFDDGADYVFGGYHQRSFIYGHPSGRVMVEPWVDVTRSYAPGGFERNDLGSDGIGLRAIRRSLWDRLGGWSLSVWPQADKEFALRAERAGANIRCLPDFLCTISIDADSLSGQFRGVNPLTTEPELETVQ